MKIAVIENVDFLPSVTLEKLQKIDKVTLYNTNPSSDEEILQRIGDAEILIIKRTKVTKNILKHALKLKYIITLTIGTAHIDTKEAELADIKVFNCPTYNAHAVAEHALALMFSVSRQIVYSNILLREGKWKANLDEFQGYEVRGKNLVVIGKGKIGSEVASLAQSLGMHVVTIDSKTLHTTFLRDVSEADYISIHVPLNERTKYLINASVIAKMKPTAFLINTCKNEIIDEKALFDALRHHKIGGCGLDVFENDPVKGNLSNEMQTIIGLPNVVATPHIAFNTSEANRRLGNELFDHLEKLL